MKTTALNRFSPLGLDFDYRLVNRVVVPPMASQTATAEGFVTPETLKHYSNLTESGAGLVIAEYSYVHPSGRSESNQLGISSDAHIGGLSELAKVLRRNGALVGIQLTHSGGKSNREMTGGPMMGPGSIAVPVKGEVLEAPQPMSFEEIELWKTSFLEGVRRAATAGFDLVEFHSAHGYGLNQWLSPITNQRNDRYGDDRSLLLLEIVRNVREVFPGLLISVRMPGQDFLEGGLKTSDTIALAKSLEAAGVNILHVSSGIGGWRRPTTRTGQGYLVEEATLVQSHVSIPVIGVGGIESGRYIDEGLSTGLFSLAAVGRAILADPKTWFERNLRSSSEWKEARPQTSSRAKSL